MVGQAAPIPNAQLLVEITDPSNTTTRTPMTTAADGTFSITFTASMIGAYAVEVEFDGDSTHDQTETTIVFNVVASILTPTITTVVAPTTPVLQGSTVSVTGNLMTNPM